MSAESDLEAMDDSLNEEEDQNTIEDMKNVENADAVETFSFKAEPPSSPPKVNTISGIRNSNNEISCSHIKLFFNLYLFYLTSFL